MYLQSFVHFRAIAILLIVAGHCYGMVGWNINTVSDRVIASLISGSTAMFVFISGFFFHHVFYKKFTYAGFLKKKLTSVVSPYLICSALAIVFYVYYLKLPPYEEQLYSQQPGVWNQHIWPILQYLWYGSASFPYWYIPFITLTFVMSPLHFRYIQLGPRLQVGILAVLVIVTMFTQRPLYNLSVLQSVLYFTPYYLLGIVASLHAETLKHTLLGKEWVLLLLTLGFAMLEATWQNRFGNYHKPLLEWGGVDLMVPQKVAMCLFFYVFLRRFDHSHNRLLSLIASTSFAIFFIHPWVIDQTGRAMQWLHITYNQAALLPVAVSIMTAGSLAIAFLVKRVAGKRSLQLIGW